ncbi:MAG TPA: PQQ-binding-like beta-propeller repeat protein [Bryobacteraceae bacterium]|nr:PQQ-binding-like beta-propeller repeat protein [Bryobacteraceae bacterium]
MAAALSYSADWTLWGGPQRDFRVHASDRLADSWPAGGPPKLWERKLGEGYSAIAVRGDTLYTMYRQNAAAWQIFSRDQEVVAALDTATGRTKWEFAYEVNFRSDQGSGPHVMPQIAGDLIFTVGATGKLHALNTTTGELVWKRDLYAELGGTRAAFGYSSHPLPYGDKLIIVAGGKGRAVAAFDQKSGRIAWAALSFRNAYSSPVLIRAGDRDQVVVLSAQQILGVDPHDGKVLWSRLTGTDPGMAFCSTPVWDAANRILVFSGAYGVGSTALRITTAGSQTTVEHLWRNNKLQSLFSNLLLTGNTMYLSRGYHGPSFLTAVDIRTGETRWSARGFANANFLQADRKLIILDEDGWLTIARPNPDGSLEILSRAPVLSRNAWTIPTLAGTTLYVRDRKVIMALNVGANHTQPRRVATQTSHVH